MTTISLPIDAIQVGERRREDMGDIGALADSINAFGLLHPIVIDAEFRLVAGGRRYAALRRLGRTEVDARLLGSLSDAERREIELEENLARKDLTPHERSRTLAALADTAKEVAKEGFRSESDRNPRGGRPREAGSLKDVSERIGVPKTTIIEARQHVAAADKYPELAAPDIPQAEAIQVAADLDRMPEPEREPARAILRETVAAPAEQRKAAREHLRAVAAKGAALERADEEEDAEIIAAKLIGKWVRASAHTGEHLLTLPPERVVPALSADQRTIAVEFIFELEQYAARWRRELDAPSIRVVREA